MDALWKTHRTPCQSSRMHLKHGYVPGMEAEVLTSACDVLHCLDWFGLLAAVCLVKFYSTFSSAVFFPNVNHAELLSEIGDYLN